MVSIRHAFQSEKTDDPAASADGQITPSRWNADLDTEMATARILGRNTAGTGAIEELDAATTRSLLQLVKGTGAGEIPVLDGSGKLATSVLPALALTDVAEVSSQAAMLALVAQQGDIAIRTDLNKTFVLATNSPSTLADWKELRTPTDVVLAVAGLTGTITAAALKTALAMTAADITDLSANGRSLVKAADYAAMRTLLGLVVGTNVQAYDADLASIAGLSPSTGDVITWGGSAWMAAAPSAGATPTLIARDEKSAGSGGGSNFAGSWQGRTINTLDFNSIVGSSLVSNDIILPVGSYEVDASCPVAGGVYRHKARLRNVTDNVVLVYGTSETAEDASPSTTNRSFVKGYFTLTDTKTIRLEHYMSSANGTGLGIAVNAGAGIPEIYSIIVLRKVA